MVSTKNETSALIGIERLQEQIDQRGLRTEVDIETSKRIISMQVREEMSLQKLTKTELCSRMGTTRPQLERILNSTDENITLKTLARAAAALGRSLKVEFV